MKISVIVSNYNYATYVGDAVDSILAQTFPAHEVIIVDDGSTDDSGRILKAIAEANERIRVVFKANGGQLSTFVAGIDVAEGDIIAFMDADDLWRPGYLERIKSTYENHPDIDFVFCRMELFGAREGIFGRDTVDREYGMSIIERYVTSRWIGTATSALSLRKNLLKRILDLPPSILAEWRTRADDILVVGGDICGAHKYSIAEALVKYRIHGSNSWYGAARDAKREYAHMVRKARMQSYLFSREGITEDLLRRAKYEFRTIPSPTRQELNIYLRACLRSSLSFGEKVENMVAMIRYYLRPASASVGRR